MRPHASRLLAFLAGILTAMGFCLPWKYYLYQAPGGAIQPIDLWAHQQLEAVLLAVLVVPVMVLAAIGPLRQAPRRAVVWTILVLGSLGCLLGIQLLAGFMSHPSWSAGSGFILQSAGAALAVLSGIMGLRPTGQADRPAAIMTALKPTQDLLVVGLTVVAAGLGFLNVYQQKQLERVRNDTSVERAKVYAGKVPSAQEMAQLKQQRADLGLSQQFPKLESKAARAAIDKMYPELRRTSERQWINEGRVRYDEGMRTNGQEAVQALRLSANAYRRALELAPRQEFSDNWAAAQLGLGSALLAQARRIGAPESVQLLVEACEALRSVLDARPQNEFPEEWASAQIILGSALTAQARRTRDAEESAELFAGAITAYQAALTVRTRVESPRSWAGIHVVMGHALLDWGLLTASGPEAERLLGEAVDAYGAALELYIEPEYEQERSDALRSLGEARDALSRLKVNP